METTERTILAKIIDSGTGLTRWAVLCHDCKIKIAAYRKQSLSELPCSICGATFKAPPGKNLKVGQVTHIIHATYPDIERALNEVPDAPEPQTDDGEPWDALQHSRDCVCLDCFTKRIDRIENDFAT